MKCWHISFNKKVNVHSCHYMEDRSGLALSPDFIFYLNIFYWVSHLTYLTVICISWYTQKMVWSQKNPFTFFFLIDYLWPVKLSGVKMNYWHLSLNLISTLPPEQVEIVKITQNICVCVFRAFKFYKCSKMWFDCWFEGVWKVSETLSFILFFENWQLESAFLWFFFHLVSDQTANEPCTVHCFIPDKAHKHMQWRFQMVM